MYGGHITDNHMHIDPLHGIGIDAVRQFVRAGGTHLILVGKTAWDWDIDATTVDDFRNAYLRTIELAGRINESTEATAYPVVGYHPSEFVRLADAHGIAYAYEVGIELIDIWESLYEDDLIVGIGEVGRPHFDVPCDVLDAANDLLFEYLKTALRMDCPLQLHTEHFTAASFEKLGELVKKAGSPRKVIKHFSPPLPDIALDNGVTASIVASRDAIRDALARSKTFFMETDYIDDASRPGAVLGPKTVPRRTLHLLEQQAMSEEDAHHIHEDLVSKTYGVDMDTKPVYENVK
ncbi:metal-dependent hydrolase [archaeon]|nr:MAG: metal-dependent hydrolase [archaeon]